MRIRFPYVPNMEGYSEARVPNAQLFNLCLLSVKPQNAIDISYLNNSK